ncbi:unnamed protein product, partial [Ectocarpus sp. 8 AP-2014]
PPILARQWHTQGKGIYIHYLALISTALVHGIVNKTATKAAWLFTVNNPIPLKCSQHLVDQQTNWRNKKSDQVVKKTAAHRPTSTFCRQHVRDSLQPATDYGNQTATQTTTQQSTTPGPAKTPATAKGYGFHDDDNATCCVVLTSNSSTVHRKIASKGLVLTVVWS